MLLETAWVLADAYGFADLNIAEALLKVIALENVEVQDERGVSAALALIARGVSLAGALHLSSRPQGSAFLSFDRTLVRRAHRARVTHILDLSAKA